MIGPCSGRALPFQTALARPAHVFAEHLPSSELSMTPSADRLADRPGADLGIAVVLPAHLAHEEA